MTDITNLLVHNSSSDDEEELDRIESDNESMAQSGGSDNEDDENENEFPQLESDSEEEVLKSTEIKRNGSTFAGMQLSKLLLTNIQRKGFKAPTPIQRKSMPPILDGQDVVGMARTGSGKTAAFVLPMINRLMKTSGAAAESGKEVRRGLRALILAPNRELALQTLRTVKDFSRKTNLKSVLLVGGDSMDDQFGMMIDNPDIVVATPGRFLHLKVEMGLSLAACEYVVFDEADRLFEMGFADQLGEILAGLPEQRQTLLFSATLPPTLVEFAKAGLRNPVLVRLDAEQKVSDQLQMAFFSVKDSERDAALLYVLQNIIQLPLMTAEQAQYLTKRANYDGSKEKREKEATGTDMPSEKATIIFVPTKHHVEYITNLLKQEGYAASFIYGSLDQSARREQLYLFKAGKTSLMVVTDVAARGVDIPLLANVINYNLPTSARVFIHRVGRTARAGHSGWAYSLVREQDLAYLVDLEVFLGRKIEFTSQSNYTGALVLGSLPRSGLEVCAEKLQTALHRDHDDLKMLQQVALRGEKLYLRSREQASKMGVHRAKEELISTGRWDQLHPIVADANPELKLEEAKEAFLAKLSANKNRETVFEFKSNGSSDAAQLMARRRQQLAPIQARLHKKQEAKKIEMEAAEAAAASARAASKKTGDTDNASQSSRAFRDEQFYMSHYEPTEVLQDRGYSFNDTATKASFELQDEGTDFASKQVTRWDKKRGKYVKQQNDNVKFIRGENGQRIPASLKSGRFDAWKQAHKIRDNDDGTTSRPSGGTSFGRRYKHNKQAMPKSADKARDDYQSRKARVTNALASGRNRHTQSTGIRTSAEIQKERAAKQKRWEKSNQPGKKRKRNGR